MSRVPTDLLKAAQAQNLLNEYGSLLQEVVESVKKESLVDISGTTTDEIALLYKYREGMRAGVTLFLQKLNSRANE